MRDVVPWHPILVFLAGTATASVLLIVVQALAGLDYRYVAITQLGPSFGLLITWYFYRDRDCELLPRTPLRGLRLTTATSAAILLAAGFVGLTWILAAALGEERQDAFHPGLLTFFLVAQLIGAVGEEFGWRGFLQPAFERVWHPGLAALVTGGIWALWHVQELADPLFFVAFAGVCVLLSLCLGRVAVGSWWQRGLLAGLVHWAVNVGIVLVADVDRVVNGDFVHRLPLLAPQVALGIVGAAWIALQMGRERRGRRRKAALRG